MDYQELADRFSGQWSSAVPGLNTGSIPLFDDPRIHWLTNKYSLWEKRVLELGTLEGGHTYMLATAGADVTTLEGNTRNFERASLVRDFMNIPAEYLLTSFEAYLSQATEPFDLVVASGVLYHSTNPIRLISQMQARADRLYIWTHTHDGPGQAIDLHGFQGFVHRYGERSPSYCGGLDDWSVWLPESELIRALEATGYQVEVVSRDPEHSGGPAITLWAERS